MSFNEILKKCISALGENNNPTYAVVAIAVGKGIARPLFTMMDKDASPETKKYAAVRECLTELIAIPTYIACGLMAGKGADFIKDSAKKSMAKHNLRFIGVCTAALLIIPGLCSVCIKPIMKKIFPPKKQNNTYFQFENRNNTWAFMGFSYPKSNNENKKKLLPCQMKYPGSLRTGMRV